MEGDIPRWVWATPFFGFDLAERTVYGHESLLFRQETKLVKFIAELRIAVLKIFVLVECLPSGHKRSFRAFPIGFTLLTTIDGII